MSSWFVYNFYTFMDIMVPITGFPDPFFIILLL